MDQTVSGPGAWQARGQHERVKAQDCLDADAIRHEADPVYQLQPPRPMCGWAP